MADIFILDCMASKTLPAARIETMMPWICCLILRPGSIRGRQIFHFSQRPCLANVLFTHLIVQLIPNKVDLAADYVSDQGSGKMVLRASSLPQPGLSL
jgi:hypothetical protein